MVSNKKENSFQNALLDAAKSGNTKFFGELFNEFYQSVFSYANSIFQDSNRSREVVQASFIALWQQIGAIDSIDEFTRKLHECADCYCGNHAFDWSARYSEMSDEDAQLAANAVMQAIGGGHFYVKNPSGVSHSDIRLLKNNSPSPPNPKPKSPPIPDEPPTFDLTGDQFNPLRSTEALPDAPGKLSQESQYSTVENEESGCATSAQQIPVAQGTDVASSSKRLKIMLAIVSIVAVCGVAIAFFSGKSSANSATYESHSAPDWSVDGYYDNDNAVNYTDSDGYSYSDLTPADYEENTIPDSWGWSESNPDEAIEAAMYLMFSELNRCGEFVNDTIYAECLPSEYAFDENGDVFGQCEVLLSVNDVWLYDIIPLELRVFVMTDHIEFATFPCEEMSEGWDSWAYSLDGNVLPDYQTLYGLPIADLSFGEVMATYFNEDFTFRFESHAYEVVASDASWTEAKEICESWGGHLATINSEEEFYQISELAEESGLIYLWLGGYTYDSWGDGCWITGESWTFENWYPGEPSYYDSDGTRESYLNLWSAKYNGTDIGWTFNDQRDDIVTYLPRISGLTGFICEYE